MTVADGRWVWPVDGDETFVPGDDVTLSINGVAVGVLAAEWSLVRWRMKLPPGEYEIEMVRGDD